MDNQKLIYSLFQKEKAQKSQHDTAEEGQSWMTHIIQVQDLI